MPRNTATIEREARLPATRRTHSNAWWIALLTAAVVASGMAYSLWWAPVVRHASDYWIYPGDLLGTVRAATDIGLGLFSYLYSLRTQVVTLPGFAILFTPVVKLSQVLHLVPATPLSPVPRPSQWLLIGPASMAASAVALAGLDALARTLGAPLWRRRALLVAEAAAVWPVVVLWGHPEDVVALGLGALALRRAIVGRTVSAGWLLGGALAMQLYAVLLVPVLVGLLGVRKGSALVARAAVLPGVLFVAVLVPNAHATLHALFDQPNFSTVNYPTPWVLAAPHLGHGAVAAGPGRVLGVGLACALGLLAWRHRTEAHTVVWLGAAALSLRCLTEAVMDPYYVAPAIAVALAAVSTRSWRRWAAVLAAGAALTVLTNYRPGMWWYWVEMAAAFAVMLAASWPRWSAARVPDPAPEAAAEDPGASTDLAAASAPAQPAGAAFVRPS